MKRLFFVFITCILLASCTNQQTAQDELYREGLDKEKVCKPNDQNCNNIPDEEEVSPEYHNGRQNNSKN